MKIKWTPDTGPKPGPALMLSVLGLCVSSTTMIFTSLRESKLWIAFAWIVWITVSYACIYYASHMFRLVPSEDWIVTRLIKDGETELANYLSGLSEDDQVAMRYNPEAKNLIGAFMWAKTPYAADRCRISIKWTEEDSEI